jgi:hypothetical protein
MMKGRTYQRNIPAIAHQRLSPVSPPPARRPMAYMPPMEESSYPMFRPYRMVPSSYVDEVFSPVVDVSIAVKRRGFLLTGRGSGAANLLSLSLSLPFPVGSQSTARQWRENGILTRSNPKKGKCRLMRNKKATVSNRMDWM